MFRKLSLFGVVLTLVIILLGSFARLSGLELTAPVIDILKGSVHVGLSSISALLALVLFFLSWRFQPRKIAVITTSLVIVLLISLQSALGFWAHAINAMPIIITTQVLLSVLTLGLFFGLYLRSNPAATVLLSNRRKGLGLLAQLSVVVVLIQIFLGVWVSANHAALACNTFPQCNGSWWPVGDYQQALNFFNGLVTGYTGVISFNAQVAANWLHRISALPSFVLLSLLMFSATATYSSKPLKTAGLWLGFLMFAEIGLGIVGIKQNMPLWIAIAHHVTAALLMLPLIAISFYSRFGVGDQLSAIIDVVAGSELVVPSVPDDISEAVYVELPAESLYLRLKSQLKRTRSGLNSILASLPISQQSISDELLEDIEASLIMADVGIDATTEIINRLKQGLERHQLNDGLALSTAIKAELLAILKPCNIPLHIPKQDGPFVILVVGVNGAGKTTTIGKLAKRLQAQGHSVMLAAGDTFRAAAVEQLQVWGERNNIHVVAQHTGADSASVIYDALQSAQAKGIDVLIADTAGRLHTKSHLMDELKKVKRIMGKLDSAAPHEVLLVLDAGTGQNALSQAKLFNEAVSLTGMALTKLDGTAKGGVIFALAKHTGIPIRFIGIGEGIDDLQDFNADQFVDALFIKD
ncbi:MAG: signal recognition particle-docking protein FtsY [Methylococcales bacterium]